MSYNNLLAGILGTPLPGSPRQFTQSYIANVINRGRRRIGNLEQRLADVVAAGRVMPDREDVTIGSGRRFNLTILFLDICNSSSRPNWTEAEQKTVLTVMNVFMAEMLSIVHDFEGTYEKNTGDGLMAYFGESQPTASDSVRPAAEAALIMHYVNDTIITPWFQAQNIEPVRFRIGLDYGPVTIARVGIHGEKSSRVAIGATANIANKLMNRIPNGGICIGDLAKQSLPHNWSYHCQPCSEPTGFVFISSQEPYPAWELTHRLASPTAP